MTLLMKYTLRHPIRALLRVDCKPCQYNIHRHCENMGTVCYCRIIREHR